jgi:hypothetical protein
MNLFGLGVLGLITGMLIGINPVLISSFVAYIKSMIGRGVSSGRYTAAGFLFLLYLGLFILFFTTIVTSILFWLTPAYQFSVILTISLIAIIYSASLIRRYFWQEPLIKPPKRLESILHDKTTKQGGIINAMTLALVTAYATVPILGIVVLIMGSFSIVLGPSSILWGLPFAVGLATPSYVVLALLSSGTKPSVIIAWKENTKGTMRLYNGLAIIAISWLLLVLLAAGGDIKL